MNKQLESCVNELKRKISVVESLSIEADIIDKLMEDHVIINHWYLGAQKDNLMIGCTINHVDEMTELFKDLATKGYHQTKEKRFTDDTIWWVLGRIEVNASLGSGASCAFVKVGERVEDIMELKCS